ncbi:hypothetical protein LTR93_009471 [Exophiala xenobiotica]|nr:hypothetical protein LTR93_009471 [Exophiala xenobiotica]
MSSRCAIPLGDKRPMDRLVNLEEESVVANKSLKETLQRDIEDEKVADDGTIEQAPKCAGVEDQFSAEALHIVTLARLQFETEIVRSLGAAK